MVTMTFGQLSAMLALMIGVWLLLRLQYVNQEKLFFLATIRMTVQLMIMSYVLIWIFAADTIWATLIAVSVMEGYAMRTLLKRTGLKLNEMSGKMAIFSLLIGTLVIQGYFAIVLFGDLNLAQAQHHIPILGMILSNALTAMILAVKTLQQGLIHRRNQIETLLMLGASRHQALLPLIKASFEAALVPTFNAMLTMGIVALPGMMTGQILAGVQPLEAVMYQIAIMCAICATTAITLTIFFLACQKLLFDEYHALKANL